MMQRGPCVDQADALPKGLGRLRGRIGSRNADTSSALFVIGLVATQRQQDPDRVVTAGLVVSFRFGALTNLPVFAGDQRAARSAVFWSLVDFGFAR